MKKKIKKKNYLKNLTQQTIKTSEKQSQRRAIKKIALCVYVPNKKKSTKSLSELRKAGKMYKIDDEFRPRGRVFMKATRESQQQSSTSDDNHGRNVVSVPIRKSSLKKGPPITTNLDDRRIQFQHEVKHEKTIEALITEYPPGDDYRPPGSRSYSSDRQHRRYESHTSNSSPQRIQAVPSTSLNDVSRDVIHYTTNDNNGYDVTDNVQSMQAITRNKRTSTEVLGSSFESKKLSQRANDGHRRITTHIVRKVTTLSRAEENAQSQNLIQTAQNKTTEIGYMTSQAIEPKKQKV